MMRGRTGTGRRRSTQAWRALVEGFAASGVTLRQYCTREGIGMASYHRWRRLLAMAKPSAAAVTGMAGMAGSAAPTSMSVPAFVDLGALPGASARLELRLEFGGGVTLQISRG
jgi:hypothetical protein